MTDGAPRVEVWSIGEETLGLSDFVRMLHEGIPEQLAAELSGLVARRRPAEPVQLPVELPVELTELTPSNRTDGTHGTYLSDNSEPVESPPPLWRAIGPVIHAPEEASEDTAPSWMREKGHRPLPRLGSSGKRLPEPAPLLPPARLGCVLRHHLRARKPGPGLDMRRLVHELSRCRALYRLPRPIRLVWPDRIQLYWDLSAAIAFTHADQRRVYEWLRRWRGERGMELVFVEGSSRRRWRAKEWEPVPAPDSGTLLLALTDLGMADGDSERQGFWQTVRREAERQGAQTVAMVLSPSRRWTKAVTAGWQALEWERARPFRRIAASLGSTVPEETPKDELIAMLSPCLRVEPALLREARKRFGAKNADLGQELDAWCYPQLEVRSREGMALTPSARRERLKVFREQDPGRIEMMEELIKEHHAELSSLILAEELLAVGTDTGIRQATESLKAYARRLERAGVGGIGELLYIERLVARQPAAAWKEDFLAAIWALANRNAERSGFTRPMPEGMSLDKVLWTLARRREPGAVRVVQTSDRLHLIPIKGPDTPTPKGSHLADLPTRIDLVALKWQDPESPAEGEAGEQGVVDADNPYSLALPGEGARALSIESDMARLEDKAGAALLLCQEPVSR